MSGTGIYAKELYYTRLYWNQSLFSHNNSNNEILFQINGDTSTTYVVYATPFLMFNEYDGNPEGTSLLLPQLNSYASNIEQGFNGDVRLYDYNQVPINNKSGVIKVDGVDIYFAFRYSPTRGFYLYPIQPVPALESGPITIQLLPCSWIQNGHFVHGFGVWNSDLSSSSTLVNGGGGVYEPRPGFKACYISDCSPNL